MNTRSRADDDSDAEGCPDPKTLLGKTISTLNEHPIKTFFGFIVFIFPVVYSVFYAFNFRITTTDSVDSQQSTIQANKSLKKEVKYLEKKLESTSRRNRSMEFSSPENDDIFIREPIGLEWNTPGGRLDGTFDLYLLEVTYLGMKSSPKHEVNTVPVHLSRKGPHYFMIEDDKFGQYLFRVRPGDMKDESIAYVGPWSSYISISIYESIEQKIIDTGKLNVAMTPAFGNPWNEISKTGHFTGYDVTIANGLTKFLKKILCNDHRYQSTGICIENDEITIKYIDPGWESIYETVKTHKADIAISSISRRRNRELENNIIFSAPYWYTHQTLMIRKDDDCPSNNDSLSNYLGSLTIGAKANTTNFELANYLALEYLVELSPGKYTKYGQLYSELINGNIDVAIVDDGIAGQFIQKNRWLTKEIKLCDKYSLNEAAKTAYDYEYNDCTYFACSPSDNVNSNYCLDSYAIAISTKEKYGLLKRVNRFLTKLRSCVKNDLGVLEFCADSE